MKTFYSQQGEDLYIFKNLINQSRSDGTYLEVGGYNGVHYSNTLLFAETLGYRGILIEPNLRAYTIMEKTRPEDKCYNYAISPVPDSASFLEPTRPDWMASGGLKDTMSDKHKEGVVKDSVETVVRTTTLAHILEDAGLRYLDILSIDVEGGELEVLKTMDWNIPIYLICIELDGENKEKDEACRELMFSQDFEYKDTLCGNEFWVNPHYERKDLLFKESQEVIEGQHPFMEPHCASEIFEKCYTQ